MIIAQIRKPIWRIAFTYLVDLQSDICFFRWNSLHHWSTLKMIQSALREKKWNHIGMKTNVHWASNETYNFLEWCPLKSTASKWMIFGLMLATVLLITHVKKLRNRMCQKWDKCLQITTSPISKSQKLFLSTAQTFGHFNSYSFKFNSGSANLLWTWIAGSANLFVNMITYWIWMNSYWNVRKSARWKREQFLWFWNWTCCDLKAFISFLAHLISLFFDVGNEEDCS